MKLKKKALEKAMTPHLEKLGYHLFKDYDFVLYAKKIQEGWYLMIGLTIARFYDDQFTVDLFLARYVIINYMSFDIPKDSSRRIGEMLTESEKLRYFGDTINDHWWSLYEDNPIDRIIELIQLVEPRLIGDEDLKQRIMSSKTAQEWYEKVQAVTRIFQSGVFSHDPVYCPLKPKNGIPLDWFWAAETFTKEKGLHPSWAQSLAECAYRQYVLDTMPTVLV